MSRAILLSMLLVSVLAGEVAGAQSIDDQAREIAQRSRGMMAAPGNGPVEADTLMDAARVIASQKDLLMGSPGAAGDMAAGVAASSPRGVVQASVTDVLAGAGQQRKMLAPKPAKLTRFVVFLSSSQGDGELRDELDALAGRRDCLVVFRGPLEGETIPNAFKRLARLFPSRSGVNAVIDPTLFNRYKVRVAPSVVREVDGAPIAWAEGTGNPDLVAERISAGKRGDLGMIAPGHEIIEPDLIETMKSRVAKLDFDGMKKRALDHSFQYLKFIQLPIVSKAAIRTFDPSFRALAEKRLPDGKLLWPAGQLINPLKMQPFGERLVVFDGTDERQIAVAKRLKREAPPNTRVILLSTAFEREDGWNAINNLQQQLGGAVYLLQAQTQERFRIEAVPCMVEADGDHFVVTEVVPERVR
jgi:conjugal transfer pilus assembly protein TraW